MEAIANIITNVMQSEVTTMIVVVGVLMGGVLLLWSVVQGHINERQRQAERTEDNRLLLLANKDKTIRRLEERVNALEVEAEHQQARYLKQEDLLNVMIDHALPVLPK